MSHAPRPLAVSQCEPTLSHLASEGWIERERAGSAACREDVRYLMPGDTATLAFRAPAEPGTYRLRVEVAMERDGLEPLELAHLSTPFRMPGFLER